MKAGMENDIRALPDQPPLSDDSFGLASDIRPSAGRGKEKKEIVKLNFL